jgi:hypothetical protein
VALIAAALTVLARGGAWTEVPRVHGALAVAAGASVAAAAGMVLHLIAAVDADNIAAGDRTPVTDLQLVIETITVPAFGLSIAVLAVIGARTHTIGNRPAAVLAVIDGVGYALAGATVLLTDELDVLFPAASGIGLWAVSAGFGLLRRSRADEPAVVPA